MHVIMHFIIPILVLVIACSLSYYIIINGDIKGSLVDFGKWAWPKLRALRHTRRLVNVPFHVHLHRRTREMPFCLGQVWNGIGKSVRLIGKAENGDWILDLGDDITGLESSQNLRNRIYDDILYLYEWDQSIDYIPTIGNMNGLKTVVLKRY
jgi:hypothetical protein